MAIDSDIITSAHIASKKLVGKSNGADVHEVVTKGAFLLKSDVLRSKMGAGCAD